MNPFKTLGHWLWRWWTGREFWEPSGPRPGESLSEWVKKFRRDCTVVHMKCVDEPANPVHPVKRGDKEDFGELVASYEFPMVTIQEPTDCSKATISIKINDQPEGGPR